MSDDAAEMFTYFVLDVFTARRAHVPELEAEERRIEVRIGELLGPAQRGSNQHTPSRFLPGKDLNDRFIHEFRLMAAHPAIVQEEIAAGRVTRRAIVRRISGVTPCANTTRHRREPGGIQTAGDACYFDVEECGEVARAVLDAADVRDEAWPEYLSAAVALAQIRPALTPGMDARPITQAELAREMGSRRGRCGGAPSGARRPAGAA